MSTDFDGLLDKATNIATFSVLDAIKGTAYPTDDIKIYTDGASAYEIDVIETRIAETEDEDKVNVLDEERKALVEKVAASALTFTLHGFAPKIVKAINESAAAKHQVEDTDTGPAAREANFRYLAEAIEKVTGADGAVDTHHWLFEEIEALEETLPAEEFARLMGKMNEIVFASLLFEQKVSADFS